MKLGIDEWCFHASMMLGKFDVLDFPAVAAQYGAAGICIDYFLLPRSVRRDPIRLKEKLLENRIEFVFGFSIPFSLPASVLKLSSGMKRRMFELAHFFGAEIIRLIGTVVLPLPGVGRPIQFVINRSAQIDRVVRNIKPFAAEARSEGLTLALENHTDFKVADMERILADANADNLKVTLDTGNAVMQYEDPYDTAARLAPHAAFTHIKNMKGQGYFSKSTQLDEGDIDIRKIMQIIYDSGYRGLYALEFDFNLPGWKKEKPAVAASLQYMKSIAQQIDPSA